jgi:hypothetical protein
MKMVGAASYIVCKLETYDKKIWVKHFNYILVVTIRIHMLILKDKDL